MSNSSGQLFLGFDINLTKNSIFYSKYTSMFVCFSNVRKIDADYLDYCLLYVLLEERFIISEKKNIKNRTYIPYTPYFPYIPYTPSISAMSKMCLLIRLS